MSAFEIRQGDVLAELREMPDVSVHMVCTSPPYWGLRDYKLPDHVWGGDPVHEHAWELSSPSGFTNHTDKRRWNHAVDGRGGRAPEEKLVDRSRTAVGHGSFCECGAWRGNLGLEPTPQLFVEHIVEIFREVRRVLRGDGTCWINLGDSYNAQPGQRKTTDKPGEKQATDIGSVGAPSRCVAGLKPKDLIGIPWRCALALQEDGWWLRQDIIWHKPAPMPESVTDRCTRSHEYIFLLTKSARYFYDAVAIAEPLTRPEEAGRKTPAKFGGADKWEAAQKQSRLHSGNEYTGTSTGTRNKRSVWTMGSSPTPDAHFATYPIELPETCILAGCPVGGLVLDPFCGAGTTGLAVLKHGRRFLGIELNAEYIQIAERRLERHCPLLATSAKPEVPVKDNHEPEAPKSWMEEMFP